MREEEPHHLKMSTPSRHQQRREAARVLELQQGMLARRVQQQAGALEAAIASGPMEQRGGLISGPCAQLVRHRQRWLAFERAAKRRHAVAAAHRDHELAGLLVKETLPCCLLLGVLSEEGAPEVRLGAQGDTGAHLRHRDSVVRSESIPQDTASAVQEPGARDQWKHAELCEGKHGQKLRQWTIGKLGEVEEGGVVRGGWHARVADGIVVPKFCQHGVAGES